MGLLDSIIGGLMGGGGGNSGMQGVLMNMLGGGNQQQGYQQQQGGYQQGGMSPMAGGMGGLMSTFQQAGLSHLMESWVGNGENQPVSPQQLQSAFGDEQVQSMASQAGMAPHDFLSQLAQHLPSAVNSMTPNGRLPDEGTVSV